MKTIIPVFILCLLLPAFGHTAPSVVGVSGEVMSGQTIIISGDDFGTHTLNVESLAKTIEDGTIGQELSKSGWTRSDWGIWADPLYATDYAHSGSKSLKCTMNATTQYNCAFAYDMEDVGPGGVFYVSWWARYVGDTDGQWKMMRVSGPLSIQDAPGEILLSTWFELQRYFAINPTTGWSVTRYLGMEATPLADGTWYRIELEYRSSSAGNSDGTLTIRRTTDAGVITSGGETDVETHHTSDDSWDYAIWQNYIGNGIDSATIWIDDIYIQTGTVSRVEICTGATWASRGKCEVQIPTAWASTSITATVNTGSLSEPSTAYLYAIDSTGAANANGYQVSIGGGSQSGLGGHLSGSLSSGGVMR